MNVQTIIQDGRECVILDRQDYQDLIDIRDHTIAMQRIAAGEPTLSDAEMDAYLAAPTPLAFWRGRAGKTQAALACEVGLSQAFLAQIETGKRVGSVKVLAKLAKALAVRIEDLIGE